MRLLNGIAIVTTLASGLIYAQAQNPQNQPSTQVTPGQSPAQTTPQTTSPATQTQPGETTPSRQTTPPSQSTTSSQSATTSTTSTQADRPSGDSRTFTGTIVNAECSQASNLPNSKTYADRAPTTSTSTTATSAEQSASSTSTTSSTKESSATTTASTASTGKAPKSVYDLERDVLRHCPANDKLTAFAVLTDDGSFYKLDEAGNSQVTTAASSDAKKKNVKNMRVTVTGTVQGDSIKVQTLSKSDKPFSL